MILDDAFIEQRRKALARFVNMIIHHPIFSQDHIVRSFLSSEEDLNQYRKSMLPIEDEFSIYMRNVFELDDIPEDFEYLHQKIQENVKPLARVYLEICNIAERIGQREMSMYILFWC